MEEQNNNKRVLSIELDNEVKKVSITGKNIEAAQALGIHTYNIRRDELVRNLFVNGVLKEGVV